MMVRLLSYPSYFFVVGGCLLCNDDAAVASSCTPPLVVLMVTRKKVKGSCTKNRNHRGHGVSLKKKQISISVEIFEFCMTREPVTFKLQNY
jgi:hypothetical protein